MGLVPRHWALLPLLLLLLLALPSSAAPLHCAFIHGSGIALSPKDTRVREDYAGYWGSVKNYAKCDTYSFMYANTVDQAWCDDRLIRLACTTALGVPDHPSTPEHNPTIRNTVVFTHSMGNLVFAEALRAGYCNLDPSAWWATVAPPWTGVEAVDHLMGYCNGTLPWSQEVKVLSDLLHYCSGANLSAAYYSMQTHFPGLAALRTVARRAMTASICGCRVDGIPSMYSVLLSLVARVMHIPEPDDGLIALHSCLAGAPHNTDWGTNASTLFYLADINHADSTCRNGDARGPTKRPCTWYGEVVAAHRRQGARGFLLLE